MNPIPPQAAEISLEAEMLRRVRQKIQPSSAAQGAPVDRGNPFSQVAFDLSQSSQQVTVRGSRLIYRRDSSSPGGFLDIETDSGGKFLGLYPGAVLDFDFQALVIKRSSRSLTAGTAELVVVTRPDDNFLEPPTGSATVDQVTALAVSTTLAAPTLATEGLDLGNVQGVRVVLSAPNGATLSGTGNLRTYYYEPGLAEWIQSNDVNLPVTISGVRRAVFQDMADFVPEAGARICFKPDAIGLSAGTTVDILTKVYRGR